MASVLLAGGLSDQGGQGGARVTMCGVESDGLPKAGFGVPGQILSGIGAAEAKPGFGIVRLKIEGAQKRETGLPQPLRLLTDLAEFDLSGKIGGG